uniref:Uncharacterized protein n=1 Tax=Anopheles albimanus TaxID=7167 RepID=A0A182FCG9_ANOAL
MASLTLQEGQIAASPNRVGVYDDLVALSCTLQVANMDIDRYSWDSIFLRHQRVRGNYVDDCGGVSAVQSTGSIQMLFTDFELGYTTSIAAAHHFQLR